MLKFIPWQELVFCHQVLLFYTIHYLMMMNHYLTMAEYHSLSEYEF